MWARTCYTEHVVLHPVGSAAHGVHSSASGGEKLMHYSSCLGGTGMDFTKSASGYIM
jgi:hypothetical protein